MSLLPLRIGIANIDREEDEGNEENVALELLPHVSACNEVADTAGAGVNTGVVASLEMTEIGFIFRA